ncbi:unnamed protein product [Cochlearia groenlandica]
MASIICYTGPVKIRSSLGSGSLNPVPNRKKPVSWWAPLFGLSPDPDNLNNIENSSTSLDSNPVKTGSGQNPVQKIRPRGCLTEEKAKELRKKIAEASTFHEVMYHSAIASRLASEISNRVDD